MTALFIECNLQRCVVVPSNQMQLNKFINTLQIDMRYFQQLFIVFVLLAPMQFAVAQTSPAAPKTGAPAKTQAKVPAPSKELVSSTKPIDAAGQKQISEFIASRCGIILEGDPSQARIASTDLQTVLRQATATPIFLRACAEGLKPLVPKIIATNDSFRINNILQVVRWTRSAEALDILIQQATTATQKDISIRIGASRLMPGCVANANLTAPQIDSAARRIRDASESETQWVVSVHEMQALAALVAVAQEAKLTAQLDFARAEFLKTLTVSTVLASKPDGQEQIFALQRGLIILRDILLKTPKEEMAKMVPAIRTLTQATKLIAKVKAPSVNGFSQSANNAVVVAGVIDNLVGIQESAPKSKGG